MTSVPEAPAPDEYRTPLRASEHESRVKSSRFVARVFPVDTEEAARTRLAALRKAEHDATHHCSAWRLGPEGRDTRFDDDGEPSGTAGAPILRQIEGAGLTGTLVVVTRWYGGTKLGTGGLIRAYGDAARTALAGAGARRRIVREPVTIRFTYDDTSPAMHTVSRFDADIVDTAYGDDTVLRLAVRRSQVDAFVDAFTEALSGRGTVRVG